MACSGGSTASRGWWRGRYGGGGVPAGLRWVGRGSGRRREVGALGGGDVDGGGGARLARWGEQGTAAAPGVDQKTKCLGEGRRRKEIYGGGLLSRVVSSPGTKGVFGRAGKIPSPRPTFSPGCIYHPGQKGPVFPRFPPNLMFVFISFYFSFKIGFHLLIQLIKL